MITGELKNKIDGIWNVLFAAGLSNPVQAIEQITFLMFIKILDDNEIIKERNAELFDEQVENPIFDNEHQNCRWHIFKHYEPDTMFKNMHEKVFPFIKHGLPVGKDSAFAKYMNDVVFAIPNALVLDKVVSLLDDLDLNDKDIMGDVYEELLSQTNSSGKMGAFRTPRHIIDLIVNLMKPTLDDTICDPAMGTAGFLCSAAKYIQNNYSNELLDNKYREHFNKRMFYGFDTQASMVGIGAMNMMLHGVDEPIIERQDSLASDTQIKASYSMIMANPPFAGTLIKETISKDLLTITDTTKTELLFISLFIKMLKVGGRCASIVPDGVLFGSSKAHKSIRKELVDNNRLEAVISMPSGVFQPYAGVKTSIIIFTKTGKGGTDNVWFYDMINDGMSLDAKRTEIEGSNIPDIIERFSNLDKEETRTRKEQSFFVPVQEIINNDYDLTINKYKEVEKEVKVYRPTKDILADIEQTQKEMFEVFEELKKMLGE